MDKKHYITPSIKEIDILSAEMLATSSIAIGNRTASEIEEANRRRNENFDWSDPWN